MKSLTDCYVLKNGVKIPCVGYGTYRTPSDEEGAEAVKNALLVGYRHIDTARNYDNEPIVAEGIRRSGLKREEVFITSKLKNTDQGYEACLDAFEATLKDLDTDYVDLYLIHWPIAPGHKDDWKARVQDSWKAMEELYEAGKIRAIGVSNFLEHHLEVLKDAKIQPMVDQLEIHPQYQQRSIVEYCKSHGIQLEAWGPLMRGEAFKNETLQQLSEKTGHTISQLLLRYDLENGIIPLPKSLHIERMKENAAIFDFSLDEETKSVLYSMNTEDYYVFHPDRTEEWGSVLDKIYGRK